MPCRCTQIYFDDSFVWELGSYAVVSIIVVTLRLIVRFRVRGLRPQGDDYMAVVVLLCFFSLTSTSFVTFYCGSPDYTERELRDFRPCEVSRVTTTKKLQLVAWYSYATFIWGLKAQVLCFLHRLTSGLPQHRSMKALAIACGLTYVALILTITASCRPFRLNWMIATNPPAQCAVRMQNFYVAVTLNVLTDAAILTVPIPLLWQMRATTGRKIVLTVLLCSGIFVISAAIVSIVNGLLSLDSALNGDRWGAREEIIGILAVNAPILKPLFYRSFWRRDFDPSKRSSVPAPEPRRPATARPIAETPPSPERKVKIGILTSVRSWGSKSFSTDSSSSGAWKHGEPTMRTDSVAETGRHDLKASWQLNDTIHHTAVELAHTAPRPLLPEPMESWPPRRNRGHQGDGLESIDEDQTLGIEADDAYWRRMAARFR